MPPGEVLRFKNYDEDVNLSYTCGDCGFKNILRLKDEELIETTKDGQVKIAKEEENFGRFACGGCGYNKYFIMHKNCVFVGPPESELKYIQNWLF